MGVREVLTAAQSPWQNPYTERLIGSVRRECSDHVIVFNESSPRRLLNLYFTYYLRSRTHLALGKDFPVSRPVQPPELGAILELPEVGGLHHRTSGKRREGLFSDRKEVSPHPESIPFREDSAQVRTGVSQALLPIKCGAGVHSAGLSVLRRSHE